jgi:hypothetical protein
LTPDVLGVPRGPGNHRPHHDYEDTRAYCAECYELWPCSSTSRDDIVTGRKVRPLPKHDPAQERLSL